MIVSGRNMVKDDVKILYKKLYSSAKGNQQILIHDIPDQRYITFKGNGSRNIRLIRDLSGFGQLFVSFNRIRYYTVLEMMKNFTMGSIEIEWGDPQGAGNDYTIMLWVPDYVTEEHLKYAMLDKLGRDDHPIDLITKPSGQYAQYLHVGAYDDFLENAGSIKEKLIDMGYELVGNFKEMYMNHTNINWPDQLKIYFRQAIRKHT
ncbi:hypothetical protein FE783_36565 [Paenibacillus mesophilus]|uniref:hypothetical protein n=1 Tax=Paenibacillus mesophilus TaxID=2582849 RepID=UPI00110DC4DB|nr:hypothetical protein [Paenibacillus mesophilus]TMV43027.1 hypothetical protein FE783_36565 [Paenibacillus mesophilus]